MLAAVTAGVSWLTGGPAMAKEGAPADACRPHNRDATGRDVTGRDVPAGLATLAPAAGVLSIADAAGAAAGQGQNALPGRSGSATTTRTLPGLTPKPALPAVSASRTLPDVVPAPAKAVPSGVPGGAALPAPSDARTLPVDARTLSTPAKAVSGPANGPANGPVNSPVNSAVPAAGSKALFPARSAVPLLAVAPAKPGGVSNAACAPQALRRAPAGHGRTHPDTQGHPKDHRHPKPEGEPTTAARPGGPAAAGDSAQERGTSKPGGQQKPGARNQGAQDGLSPVGSAHSSSSQSAASGQEQSTETFPPRDRRHRKGHHPRKQHGVTAPEQAGRAGRPVSGAQNEIRPAGERKNADRHRRQRHDDARGRGVAQAVQPDAGNGRHVQRPQPREYPRASANQQNGDITSPAALTKATGARAVTDLATATGKKLLP